MGANGMAATIIPSRNEQENNWDFVICSGGDDQSLALCSGKFIANNDKSNKYVSIDSVNLYRFDGSSGSAINCVELMINKKDNNNDIYITSVGYDRRLSLWKYDNSYSINSSNGCYNDLIKTESCLYPLVINASSKVSNRILKWLSGQMVSAGDVGSMDASFTYNSNRQKDSCSDSNSDIFADIVVAGEGMQMFQIKL
jgi:hypothetical protein